MNVTDYGPLLGGVGGGFPTDHQENNRGNLPNCVILCFNSDIKIN